MAVDVQSNIDTSSGRGAADNADAWASVTKGMVMAFQLDNRRLGMIAEQVLFNDNAMDAKTAYDTPHPPGVPPTPPVPHA